jgi:hypothetical protein
MEEIPQQISGIGVRATILKAIDALGTIRDTLYDLAEERAKTEADYDLALKQAIVLRKEAGEAVTLIEKEAKGDCRDEKYKMLAANLKYSATLKDIEIREANLNALQSIYRNLDEA